MASKFAAGDTSDDDLYECPVGFKPFKDPRPLNCGHQFGEKCLSGIREQSPQQKFCIKKPTCYCPECEAELSYLYDDCFAAPSTVKFDTNLICPDHPLKQVENVCHTCEKVTCDDCLISFPRNLFVEPLHEFTSRSKNTIQSSCALTFEKEFEDETIYREMEENVVGQMLTSPVWFEENQRADFSSDTYEREYPLLQKKPFSFRVTRTGFSGLKLGVTDKKGTKWTLDTSDGQTPHYKNWINKRWQAKYGRDRRLAPGTILSMSLDGSRLSITINEEDAIWIEKLPTKPLYGYVMKGGYEIEILSEEGVLQLQTFCAKAIRIKYSKDEIGLLPIPRKIKKIILRCT